MPCLASAMAEDNNSKTLAGQESKGVESLESHPLYSIDISSTEIVNIKGDASSENTPQDSQDPQDQETAQKILKQVEFYFSDVNLPTDNFLMKHVKSNEEGWVSIKVIAGFRKIKNFKPKNQKFVADSLRQSELVEVNGKGTMVRRIQPLPATDLLEVQERTVVAENLGERVTIEGLEEIFSKVGTVRMVRICQPNGQTRSTTQTIGANLVNSAVVHALVEFELASSAERAVKELTDDKNWRSGLRVRPLSRSNNPQHNSHKPDLGSGGAGRKSGHHSVPHQDHHQHHHNHHHHQPLGNVPSHSTPPRSKDANKDANKDTSKDDESTSSANGEAPRKGRRRGGRRNSAKGSRDESPTARSGRSPEDSSQSASSPKSQDSNQGVGGGGSGRGGGGGRQGGGRRSEHLTPSSSPNLTPSSTPSSTPVKDVNCGVNGSRPQGRRSEHLNSNQKCGDHDANSHGTGRRSEHGNGRRSEHGNGSGRKSEHGNGSGRKSEHGNGSGRKSEHGNGSGRKSEHGNGSGKGGPLDVSHSSRGGGSGGGRVSPDVVSPDGASASGDSEGVGSKSRSRRRSRLGSGRKVLEKGSKSSGGESTSGAGTGTQTPEGTAPMAATSIMTPSSLQVLDSKFHAADQAHEAGGEWNEGGGGRRRKKDYKTWASAEAWKASHPNHGSSSHASDDHPDNRPMRLHINCKSVHHKDHGMGVVTPKKPDGTKGFTRGRGKPLSSPDPIGEHILAPGSAVEA